MRSVVSTETVDVREIRRKCLSERRPKCQAVAASVKIGHFPDERRQKRSARISPQHGETASTSKIPWHQLLPWRISYWLRYILSVGNTRVGTSDSRGYTDLSGTRNSHYGMPVVTPGVAIEGEAYEGQPTTAASFRILADGHAISRDDRAVRTIGPLALVEVLADGRIYPHSRYRRVTGSRREVVVRCESGFSITFHRNSLP